MKSSPILIKNQMMYQAWTNKTCLSGNKSQFFKSIWVSKVILSEYYNQIDIYFKRGASEAAAGRFASVAAKLVKTATQIPRVRFQNT